MLRAVGSAALGHRDLIVEGSIDRAILHLGAPAAMAALLQAGFLVVDTFWLGRVGAVAIAAVSTAGFVMWLAQTLGEGTATGSASLLAGAVGAADLRAIADAAAAGLAIAVWGGALVTGLGLLALQPTFAFMGTEPAVTRAGTTYLAAILAAMPVYFVFAWIAAAFRATGDAATPLRLLAVAALVNVVLDPILIFGLGPFPRLEVLGAAIATILSWGAATLTGWVLIGRIGVRPHLAQVSRPPRIFLRALRVGLPLAAEGAFFSLIYIALTKILTQFGTDPVAALGIGHKLEVFNYFVCAGMGAAATTLVGQSLGARRPARATRAAWRALFLTVVLVGAVTTVLVAVPEVAVSVFIDDAGVIAAAVPYVLLVGLSQPFMAAEVVLVGAFAGAQRTAVPASIEIFLTAARIPLAVVLVTWGAGVLGVWAAIALTTVLKGFTLAVLFFARRSDHAVGSVG